MTLKANTQDGKMPPRDMASWRAGLIEDDRSEQINRAKNGDPDAQAMERTVTSTAARPEPKK